jgi:hypothetical protein
MTSMSKQRVRDFRWLMNHLFDLQAKVGGLGKGKLMRGEEWGMGPRAAPQA